MSNTRKLRVINATSGKFQRNRNEWSGAPGNPTTQLKLIEAQRAAKEASRKPRFILQPKPEAVNPTLLPETEEQPNALGL